ncbi:MAG: hypothetical protein ACT4OP_08575 [Actinomycetota bacterium]
MTEAKPLDLGLLDQALKAARAALRRLDQDRVPARLRDVSRRSGRLPPPLRRLLVEQLDRNEWLRKEALKQWPEADPERERSDEAVSALFLMRPEGWEQRLDLITAERQSRQQESRLDRAEAELKKLTIQLKVSESELADARRAASTKGPPADTPTDELERLKRSVAGHKGRATRLDQQLEKAAEELARLLDENADLRGELVAARRRRTRSQAQTEETPTPRVRRGGLGRKEGRELARQLDDVFRSLAVKPVYAVEPDALAPVEHLELPWRIRPDRAEALDWLIAVPSAVVVGFDGWNLAHHLATPPGPRERDRVIEIAQRISARALGKLRVVVVFDSRQADETFSASDVEVRFVPSADEELIEMASTGWRDLVIITSDRRVREEAGEHGAIGLWSEAVIEWLGGTR